MRSRLVLFLILAAVLNLLTPLESVFAARGAPGSAEFGFGAHLHLNGPFAIEGVRLASDLQLDWLGIDLSWRSVAPKSGAVDWSRLDPILETAARSQLAVMVSLTDAPDWALTPRGLLRIKRLNSSSSWQKGTRQYCRPSNSFLGRTHLKAGDASLIPRPI